MTFLDAGTTWRRPWADPGGAARLAGKMVDTAVIGQHTAPPGCRISWREAVGQLASYCTWWEEELRCGYRPRGETETGFFQRSDDVTFRPAGHHGPCCSPCCCCLGGKFPQQSHLQPSSFLLSPFSSSSSFSFFFLQSPFLPTILCLFLLKPFRS